MKRKTILTIVALITLLVAIGYLAVLLLWQFGVLPQYETEESLFVKGYWFMPLPIVGLTTAILLQVFSVRSAKKKRK